MVDFLGVMLLAAWTAGVWCFISVLGAKTGLTRKAIWGAVLLVPVLGVLAWFLIGPRSAK